MKLKIKLVGTEEYLKFRKLREEIEEADRKSAELYKRKLELQRELEDIDNEITVYQSVDNNLDIYVNALNSNKLWVNDEQSSVAEVYAIRGNHIIDYRQHNENGENRDYTTSSRSLLRRYPNPINEETFRKIKNTWQK